LYLSSLGKTTKNKGNNFLTLQRSLYYVILKLISNTDTQYFLLFSLSLHFVINSMQVVRKKDKGKIKSNKSEMNT